MLTLLALLAATPTPAPTPVATPGRTAGPARELAKGDSGQPRGLADLARERKLTAKTFDVPSAPTRTAREPVTISVRGEAGSSSQDAEEAKWRERAARAQKELERTERNLESAMLRYPIPPVSRIPTPEDEKNIANRERLLEIWRVDVRAAKAAQEALAEECRKTSGCAPGWLRP